MIPLLKQILFPLLGGVLLAGCTATGSGPDGPGARPPVSSMAPANEAQQRAKVHTELGSLYLLEGRIAVAQEEARIALTADSSYAPALNLLALAHMALNEPRLAEDNFERALRLAPADPEISNNYGWFLCQHGREKAAMPHFMTAARNPLYPTPTRAYTNAGICAARVKDDKAAEDYLMQALRLAPNNTQALYWLADTAYRQGRHVEARQWLSEGEKLIEPTVEMVWLALRVERKLGNREAELRYANQLRRRFGNSREMQLYNQGSVE